MPRRKRAELTTQLQLHNPRHTNRTQMPPGEAGSVTKKLTHSVIYKQKHSNYKEALRRKQKWPAFAS